MTSNDERITRMPEGPGPELRYQAALDHGRFEIQKCAECNRHVFSPRVACPHCGSSELTWVEPSGRGAVYATTTVRVSKDAAHNVSIVELDEGVRLMSRVEGFPLDDIRIGLPVLARVEVRDGKGVVVFVGRSEQ